jgi:predicted sugar kinase
MMRSSIFQGQGLPDADYDFDTGRNASGVPVINFRSAGNPLIMIELSKANELKNEFEKQRDTEAAALFDKLIDYAKKHTTPGPLYVDASRSARMDHGASTQTFLSLAEAKWAFERLPISRQEIATITSASQVYQRQDIERFHYQRSV